MSKEDISITYENNIFYCTKNNTKWISVDGEKWYVEEKRIKELENKIADIKANCDLAIEGRDIKIKELEQLLNQYVEDNTKVSDYITKLETQIMKMRCCSNCRYKYKYCSWTSETIKDGKITSHYWNKEKQAYCDVGEEVEYQLWEIREK